MFLIHYCTTYSTDSLVHKQNYAACAVCFWSTEKNWLIAVSVFFRYISHILLKNCRFCFWLIMSHIKLAITVLFKSHRRWATNKHETMRCFPARCSRILISHVEVAEKTDWFHQRASELSSECSWCSSVDVHAQNIEQSRSVYTAQGSDPPNE